MNFANFQRPQRYIGNEWNVVKKSHFRRISFCFCYPDLYEIGMSNLGTHIIYGLLNQYPDLVCERAFMPAEDLANYLKAKKQPLFSLETKTALNKFEVLGFHLGCELNFTNVLHILALSCIEIKASQRKNTIVIGGGVANPEPLAEFIDVFYLGEFEAVAESFIEILRRCKDKPSRLRALAELEGFYVPSLYQAGCRPIKRLYLKDLNNTTFLQNWLTPYTEIVHDRIPIEIARGCPNRCCFCQARAIYAPYRERKTSLIQDLLKTLYTGSGYENFSFLALSASDYSQIEELIDSTSDYCQRKRIGLSLPSLRASDIVGRLYGKLSKLKKTSLTVAVEAASDCLRKSLNKEIDVEILFEAAKLVQSLGAKQIKVYFMYGFSNESEQDLVAIGDFLKRLSGLSRLKLTVSINAFIPKPFSLFEASPMLGESILRQKRQVIIRNLPRRSQVRVSFSSIRRSILEAVVSRAGREFSRVIYRAFLNGACFDGYREKFSWEIWQTAMEQEGVDYRLYLDKFQDNLPWSFISCKA